MLLLMAGMVVMVVMVMIDSVCGMASTVHRVAAIAAAHSVAIPVIIHIATAVLWDRNGSWGGGQNRRVPRGHNSR